ncbi:hypothetical protein B7P43_G06038 [Cryptotermes secundus]|uniref:Uncharacterized protein n=1 Tax=Cryptotermes secundus TaxID=105785 RepID=A0A2J7RSL9_9NEOP|nr:hypothetical protein B7P43_G06038 [Cryptotermes secundus]
MYRAGLLILAVKRVEFVSDMSYIILRCSWCEIILNVHAPMEDKITDIKHRFYKELERILKPMIGNESLQEFNTKNGIRVVYFATSKNLTVESTMFPHHNIHRFTWTSPDGKTHNQIDHILIDRRQHSSIIDV